MFPSKGVVIVLSQLVFVHRVLSMTVNLEFADYFVNIFSTLLRCMYIASINFIICDEQCSC